jgi:WD40 repeat protein
MNGAGWMAKCFTWCTVLAFCLFVLGIPQSAHCEPSNLSKTSESKMNDVATKIVELLESYPNVIIYSVDFNPDASRVAIESDGEKINIWDWRQQRIAATIERPHGAKTVAVKNPLQYSPNGKFLSACFSGAVDGIAGRVWTTEQWSIAKDIVDKMRCVEMRFSPKGEYLLRVGEANGDNFVVYSTESWEPLWGLNFPLFRPASLSINPNGLLAAVTGSRIVIPQGIDDPIKRIQQTKFEPIIQIVDLNQRKIVATFKCTGTGPSAWSPDGSKLAVVGGSYLEVFDARSGQVIVREYTEGSGDMNVRYTPDGRYLIQSNLIGRGPGLGVKIWGTQSNKLLQQIPGDIGSMAVSRDSKYLALGTTLGRTSIWQVK